MFTDKEVALVGGIPIEDERRNAYFSRAYHSVVQPGGKVWLGDAIKRYVEDFDQSENGSEEPTHQNNLRNT